MSRLTALLARFFAFVFKALHMQRDRPKDEHEQLVVVEAPRLYVVANRPCTKEAK